MNVEPSIPPAALAAIRAPFSHMRAQTIHPPVLQPLGLILDLAGEAMRERLILVQADGGPEAALRPDFTIPAARAHIDSGKATGRYHYEGKAFRAQPRGQAGFEEFLQIGLEVFEVRGAPEADAQIAALAWRSAAAGGRDDLTLHLGDVALFAAFLDAIGLAEPLAARIRRAFASPRRLREALERAGDGVAPAAPPVGERLAGLLAGLPEVDAAAALEDLWSVAGIEPAGGRSAAEIVHRLSARAAAARAPDLDADQAALITRFLAISDAPAAALDAVSRLAGPGGKKLEAALKAWTRRLDALEDEGAPADRMRLATAFGRDFGYYDGVLFEVRSAALGDGQPVAAGGRYDSLPARLGASLASGAVGCMAARSGLGGSGDMSETLILALPSKGRLKEQTEAWLSDCGLPVRSAGGERGYAGRLDGLPGIEVRFMAAGEIAQAVFGGLVHLGVTGEDLLRELSDDLDAKVMLLRALGFGRADLVVAAPKSWIDVDTMADVDEVAHLYLARTGRRLRVATKYLTQTRAFFARHGVVDYRIVESGGATEGAPAAGTAELVCDITTTGATLAANGLKVLGDGLILASQAQLAASLDADWNAARLDLARRFGRIVEARARARRTATLTWPAEQDDAARAAVADLAGASARPFGLLIDSDRIFAVADALATTGVGPLAVAHPAYVFEPACDAVEAFAARLPPKSDAGVKI